MGLNIKNEATCALARELADLTGETMTGAIYRWPCASAWSGRSGRGMQSAEIEEMLAIGERCAARLGPGPSSSEIGEFLYDEHGLPK